MSRVASVRVSDLRGGARILVDATIGVTGVVEGLHLAVSRPSDPVGITTGIARLVYATVRAVTAFVGNGLDAVAAVTAPFLDEEGSSAGREAALAIVNGVVGDYLADSGNLLTIAMQFRRDGRPIEMERAALAARPDTSGKVRSGLGTGTILLASSRLTSGTRRSICITTAACTSRPMAANFHH